MPLRYRICPMVMLTMIRRAYEPENRRLSMLIARGPRITNARRSIWEILQGCRDRVSLGKRVRETSHQLPHNRGLPRQLLRKFLSFLRRSDVVHKLLGNREGLIPTRARGLSNGLLGTSTFGCNDAPRETFHIALELPELITKASELLMMLSFLS